MTEVRLPSIWLGDLSSKADFDRVSAQLGSLFSVCHWIDDRLLFSRHSFTYPAYCTGCNKVTSMRID
jgi:hypothetical protein